MRRAAGVSVGSSTVVVMFHLRKYLESIPTGVFTMLHARLRLLPLPCRLRRGTGRDVELRVHRRRADQPGRGGPDHPARLAVPAAGTVAAGGVPGTGQALAAMVELASTCGRRGALPAGVPAAGLRGRHPRGARRYGGPDRRTPTAAGRHRCRTAPR